MVKLTLFLIGLSLGLNIINKTNKDINISNEEIIEVQERVIKTNEDYIYSLTNLLETYRNKSRTLYEVVEEYEVAMGKTLEENIKLKRKLSKYNN